MTESLVFLFCILSVCTAVTTCLSSKIIRSTFFFGVTLFLIAFIFIVVGSTLLGIIQILLYTGGTLVLFLFSIFLTGNWDYNNLGETFSRPILAITISFIFFITLSFLISESQTFIDLEKNFNLNSIASTKNVSKSLFNDWVFILEISSILLLATIVGCLTLLKFRKEIK
ncbi:MAG: NADH-quinone oxidoreductase subunit J [Thermodesulfobacteriota bacterium]|jgi:NADH-quinone oxidoreductase subunit J|nr:NADH-quinone oxidoreductase subunit J [Thermodesulfobacteriota bacterium]